MRKHPPIKMYASSWQDFFPYTPRRGQADMMYFVSDELKKGHNIGIEAQNGWGKTPTSISAALACTGSTYDKVIICSRTHEQIQHVVDEIKKIVEKKSGIECVVLAAKKRLCSNPWCKGEEFVNCEEYIYKDGNDYVCSFEYLGNEEIMELLLPVDKPIDLPPVLDISTAKSVSKYDLYCPYYLVKSAAGFSNIIVTPYNFVFSIPQRSSFGLDVSSSIIVVDEAHNLPSICRSLNTASISIQDVTKTILFLRNNVGNTGVKSLLHFRSWLEIFISRVKNKKVKGWSKGFKRGNLLLHEMYEQNLKKEHVIDAAQAIGNATNLTLHASNVYSFFSLILSTDSKKSIAYVNGDRFFYTLLDVKEAIHDILQQGSRFLFMSGTLSPIESFKKEMGIKLVYKAFENNLPPRLFEAEIIASSDNGIELTTGLNSRENEDMLISYGEVLSKLIQHIPNGSIIMFPSYKLKEDMYAIWQLNDIITSRSGNHFLNRNIRIYNEQKGFEMSALNRYKKDALDKQTALFSVFRGKVTEGTDLPHELCRGIFIIGIPFANWGSPVIRGLIDYYNNNMYTSQTNNLLSGPGETWYYANAISVVNQGIGRGVRDPENDYAKAFLIDSRYVKRKALVYNKLSDWIRNNIINEYGSSIESAEQRTKDFFCRIKKQ